MNRLTMGQLVNVILAIDNVHTALHMALDRGPGLSRSNQVCWPNRLTPSSQSICGKYNTIFTSCTNKNQFDIIMTAAANFRKGQTDSHTNFLDTGLHNHYFIHEQ